MRRIAQTTEDVAGHGNEGASSEVQGLNLAVGAAFRIYEYRELEHNLKTFGWRKARRRVLGNGAPSGEWVRCGVSEVRLSRRGLEVRPPGGGKHHLSWQYLWEVARGPGGMRRTRHRGAGRGVSPSDLVGEAATDETTETGTPAS
jgi:hypothetical protein